MITVFVGAKNVFWTKSARFAFCLDHKLCETVKVWDYIKLHFWQWSFDKCKCWLQCSNRALEAVFCVDFNSDRENNSWEKNCRLRRPLCGTKPTQFTVICAHKLFQQLGHSVWSLFCISLLTFYQKKLPSNILWILVRKKNTFLAHKLFQQLGHSV